MKGHLWNTGADNWGYGGLPENPKEYKDRYTKSLRILRELKGKGVAGAVQALTMSRSEWRTSLVPLGTESFFESMRSPRKIAVRCAVVAVAERVKERFEFVGSSLDGTVWRSRSGAAFPAIFGNEGSLDSHIGASSGIPAFLRAVNFG